QRQGAGEPRPVRMKITSGLNSKLNGFFASSFRNPFLGRVWLCVALVLTFVLPPAIQILLKLVVPFRPLDLFLEFIGTHPVFGAIVLLLLSVIFGLTGHRLGLPKLFWHERRSTQFVAGASTAALYVLIQYLT